MTAMSWMAAQASPETRPSFIPEKRKGGRQYNHPQHVYDDIYRMIGTGEFSYRQIARCLGVSPAMVCQMAKRKAAGYDAPVSKPKLTREGMDKLEWLVSEGMTVREAAEHIGVSYHSAACAIRRKLGKGVKAMRVKV